MSAGDEHPADVDIGTSWDGVAYRSYTAAVAVDCAAKTGRYLSLDFFHAAAVKGWRLQDDQVLLD